MEQVDKLGGGSGGGVNDSKFEGQTTTSVSSAGGTGTSYSGGTGGGGLNPYNNAPYKANDGGANGGAGGAGVYTYWGASGGAGNPGGKGVNGGTNGSNGTGGLLIIYANDIHNSNGTINSLGSTGGNSYVWGGDSGAGSINIFYSSTLEKGEISAKSENNGGNGTESVGRILNGTYVED